MSAKIGITSNYRYFFTEMKTFDFNCRGLKVITFSVWFLKEKSVAFFTLTGTVFVFLPHLKGKVAIARLLIPCEFFRAVAFYFGCLVADPQVI